MNEFSILTSTEMSQLIEYLCIIELLVVKITVYIALCLFSVYEIKIFLFLFRVASPNQSDVRLSW